GRRATCGRASATDPRDRLRRARTSRGRALAQGSVRSRSPAATSVEARAGVERALEVGVDELSGVGKAYRVPGPGVLTRCHRFVADPSPGGHGRVVRAPAAAVPAGCARARGCCCTWPGWPPPACSWAAPP